MKPRYDYIVSACLAGLNTRFDGTSCKDRKVSELVKRGKALPICPELLGGLSIPRFPAQIVEGEGKDVLNGRSRVINQEGEDITEFFTRGAYRFLEIAKLFNIRKAIMKDKSPSCGCGRVHSSKGIIRGDGVTTSLLRSKGLEIISL